MTKHNYKCTIGRYCILKPDYYDTLHIRYTNRLRPVFTEVNGLNRRYFKLRKEKGKNPNLYRYTVHVEKVTQ